MAKIGQKSSNQESINIICIDFHGVLTNGRRGISSDGYTDFEYIHIKDTSAIRELAARGYEVYILTSSSSPIIDEYCRRLGVIKIQDRLKQNIFTDKPYVAIGDASFDVGMLKNAEIAYCPADAEDVIRAIPGINILKTNGGDGCIGEILKDLI